MGENALLEQPPRQGRERYLIIVARDHPDLWRALMRHLVGDEGVQVILDRRRQARRQHGQTREVDRRRADRRQPPQIERDLRYRSFVIVDRRDGPPGG
jgi:hypothetical protein